VFRKKNYARCYHDPHNPAHYPHPDLDWLATDLAVQRRLGILPERRLRPFGRYCNHSSIDGTNIGYGRRASLSRLAKPLPESVSRKRWTEGMRIFDHFARWTERQLGRSLTFSLAFLLVVLWAVTGPLFGWSDTWQLVINTGTTIVTFLMVFVIQNTQNRDTQALQLKLDELIRATATARNSLMALEEKPQSEVEEIKSGLVERTS
jgi:low affinity Fe/Cu permease